MKALFHGTETELNKEGQWVYSDTKEEVCRDNIRACLYCNKMPTPDGHDACLGKLTDVKFACCGHHHPLGHPYLMRNNGLIIEFESTEQMHEYLGIKGA